MHCVVCILFLMFLVTRIRIRIRSKVDLGIGNDLIGKREIEYKIYLCRYVVPNPLLNLRKMKHHYIYFYIYIKITAACIIDAKTNDAGAYITIICYNSILQYFFYNWIKEQKAFTEINNIVDPIKCLSARINFLGLQFKQAHYSGLRCLILT